MTRSPYRDEHGAPPRTVRAPRAAVVGYLAGWLTAVALACAADEPCVDVPATQEAVETCLTTRLEVPLRLPAAVPPAPVAWVEHAPIPVEGCEDHWTGCTVYRPDGGPALVYVTTWEVLPHELVHYLLDQAGLEASINNWHLHPGFARCGGPELLRWR